MCSQRVLTIGWIALILIAGAAVAQAQSVNLTGEWTVLGVNNTNAGFYDNVVVTQVGNNVTVSINGGTLTGTLAGYTLSLTGSYPEGGGTSTITSLRVTVYPQANRMEASGASNWTWTNGVEFRSGTTYLAAIRHDPPVANASGDWDVFVNGQETYRVSIDQQGSALVVKGSTLDGEYFTLEGVLYGDTFGWIGAIPEEGGTTYAMVILTMPRTGIHLAVVHSGSGRTESPRNLLPQADRLSQPPNNRRGVAVGHVPLKRRQMSPLDCRMVSSPRSSFAPPSPESFGARRGRASPVDGG